VLYEIKTLRKVYDGRAVLDLESLHLERGKITGLLGPNGAGKTTLLEILAFLLRPTSGSVWFEGEEADFASSRIKHLRRKVVLVQQKPILFTTAVYKNLAFPLKIRKMGKKSRWAVIQELLDLVGMGEFAHARAHALSGGETQRIAIARALACFPEVILLDEPTSNVDMEHQITIERIIRSVNVAKGISVIFTTHNMMQASRLADETLFLLEGKLAQSVHENIFTGIIETDSEGSRYCLLPNGLKLAVNSDKVGPVRVSIDPAALKIGGTGQASLPDHAFRGKLIQVADEHGRVRATVDVGIPLSVLIPKESFKGLRVTLGEEVRLTCPPGCIEVL